MPEVIEGPSIEQEIAQLNPAQVTKIEEALTMLTYAFRRPIAGEKQAAGERVDISFVMLLDLPVRIDSVFSALEVTEALGYRVDVELVRGGKADKGLPYGLQFFTHRLAPDPQKVVNPAQLATLRGAITLLRTQNSHATADSLEDFEKALAALLQSAPVERAD